MADELGQAVLKLALDTQELTVGLSAVERLVSQRIGKIQSNIAKVGKDFVIELQPTSISRLEKFIDATRVIETQLKRLKNTPVSISDPGLGVLSKEYKEFAREVVNTGSGLGNTELTLRNQVGALRALAANLKAATPEYTNLTQAAAKAQQKLSFRQFGELSAVSQLFKLGKIDFDDSFKGTEDLLTFGRKIQQTPAAINLYVTALREALAVTDLADPNFNRLTEAIIKQQRALDRASAAAERYARANRPRIGFGGAPPVATGFTEFSRRATRITEQTKADREQAEADERNARIRETRERRLARIAVLRRRKARGAAIGRGFGGALGSGLVGGAFPLLFGQGAGAAAGGFLGGAGGGALSALGKGPPGLGFGLSLVGTVLGQAFDQGIEKAKVLASALDSPVQNFQALADAGLISSKSLKNTIQALLETGRTAEAAALIQQDLASRQFDPEAIKELEENTQQLTNRWNDLSLTLAAVGAGPLSDIIAGFNKLLGGSVDRGNFANLDKEIAQAVALERKKIAAEQGTEKLAELDPQILEARFRNDKLRTAELEKQKLAIQKINALAAFGTISDADKIRRQKVLNDFKLKELKIEQDIQRARTEQFIKQLQLQSEEGAFGATEASKVFDKSYVLILSALAQFGPASLEFKLALQEGANAILESTKSAAERLRDANRSLRDLRLGNLRFLPAGQRQELLREQARKAIPEARRRGVALRGLADVLSFNRFIEQEQGGLQARADAERNMTDANNNLRSEIITQTGALTQLTTVMDRLIDKSWAVYVNVPSQNAASALNMATQLN